MYFCLRVDLDYVPWDTPDAADYGHGEPAVVLRLLELARHTGFKFHFFVSNRVLRALPATPEAILNDGHDLDWLCKHPENAQPRFTEAASLFQGHGHELKGLAIKGQWPADSEFEGVSSLKFLSAAPGPVPGNLRLFPVETKTVREALRAGLSVRAWTDGAKAAVREHASRNLGITLVVRPQVLAKFDTRLSHVREILDIAQLADMPVMTLRDVMRAS